MRNDPPLVYARREGFKRLFRVYQDAAGQWRWNLIAVSNGKIVTHSGESFDTKGNAMRSMRRESSFYKYGMAGAVVFPARRSTAFMAVKLWSNT